MKYFVKSFILKETLIVEKVKVVTLGYEKLLGTNGLPRQYVK